MRGSPAAAVDLLCAVSPGLSIGWGDLQEYNKAAVQTQRAYLHTLQTVLLPVPYLLLLLSRQLSVYSSHAPTILQST